MRRNDVAFAGVCLAFAFATVHAEPLRWHFDATLTFDFGSLRPVDLRLALGDWKLSRRDLTFVVKSPAAVEPTTIAHEPPAADSAKLVSPKAESSTAAEGTKLADSPKSADAAKLESPKASEGTKTGEGSKLADSKAAETAKLENPKPSDSAKSAASPDLAVDPKIAVARVSKTDLASVFAGTAAPGASVTLLDNGVPIATATANDNGDWSVATEHKFASADPPVTVRASPPMKTESPPEPAPSSIPEKAAPAVTVTGAPVATAGGVLKNFERLVESARKEEQVKSETKSPAVANAASPSTAATVSAPKEVLPALPPTKTVADDAAHLPAADIPIPMTFVFDQATLTTDGEKTAKLLLEYLRLKKFTSVTLTGHADERGTAEYNMELSRKRLDTVSEYLKKGGYVGKLELVPKGYTEPFGGVNRSRFSHEEQMQLDRRVELRNAT